MLSAFATDLPRARNCSSPPGPSDFEHASTLLLDPPADLPKLIHSPLSSRVLHARSATAACTRIQVPGERDELDVPDIPRIDQRTQVLVEDTGRISTQPANLTHVNPYVTRCTGYSG